MGAYEHPDLTALDEIEDLLEAYAEAQLSPAGPVLARIRRAVLAEAAATAAAQAIQRRMLAQPAERVPPRWVPRFQMPRPVFAAGFAAILTLGTGAAVLAAPPGSPFYNARVALEEAFLPTNVDDRLTAHGQHLEDRLAEAEAAAARGDPVALAAALAAYEAEVAQALAEVGNDADRLALLEAMLGKHVAILEALEAEVPEQAAIDKALEHSQKAIVKIKEQKAPGRPSTAPGGPPDVPGGRP